MAAGFDELLDYLLSEIALCGVQGAGSADFRRFVQAYFEQPHTDDASQSESNLKPTLPPGGLGRTFYEKVWHWVSNHADIQITHKDEIRQYSLPEFEAAELQDANVNAAVSSTAPSQQSIDAHPGNPAHASNALLAMRESLRHQLLEEQQEMTSSTIESGQNMSTPTDQDHEQLNASSTKSVVRTTPRKIPSNTGGNEAIFDEPTSSAAGPRLYASQNRIWQALTGHSIDLKKVPSMEFILLSLIASRGVNGITQPDLTVMSGQDKRSVPHRTDELSRKGYIQKMPVQAGKMRTSLCVHKKFVTKDHFLSSGKVEDVFQHKKFVLSGFIRLLHDKLKDSGVVLSRDIRKKLNVPMSTWNKRAVQGALIRLDQTGMIKRFRAHRKGTDDEWITCIQVLREPREEDLDNLKFRRQVNIDEPDEQLDEDVDGETLMRDLEVDMLNVDQSEGNASSEDSGRIPPQWVPDRMLSSILFEVVDLGGSEGWDAGMLRDRIVGKFWRRPMESYVSRLTDDWEKTQPPHLRHLALIRDTRNTQEKKFVHYVYRTYKGFQAAVDKGEAAWAGVIKPAPKQTSVAKGKAKKKGPQYPPLDRWGFPTTNLKDFVGRDGSATLAEIRSAIVHGRKNGPRWDIALTEEIGYQKVETPKPPKPKTTKKTPQAISKKSSKLRAQDYTPVDTPNTSDKENVALPDKQADEVTDEVIPTAVPASTITNPDFPTPTNQAGSSELTAEQRVALGLKPTGRLSKHVVHQIREHRQKTGDPTSIPTSIAPGTPVRQTTLSFTKTTTPNNKTITPISNTMTPASKTVSPVSKPVKRTPLMTKEERVAAGLPARGRLGKEMENQIREQRGLSKLPEKQNRPRNQYANEPPLLSKQQRIDMGINPNGRLPQGLMDGLREERHSNIPLEQSSVLKEYLDMLKAIKDGSINPKTTFTPQKRISSTPLSQVQKTAAPESVEAEADASFKSPSLAQTKRKADFVDDSAPSKRPRTTIDLSDPSARPINSAVDTPQDGDIDIAQPAALSEDPPGLASLEVDAAQADVVQTSDTHAEKTLPDVESTQTQEINTDSVVTQPLRASGGRRRTTTTLVQEGSPEADDTNLSLDTSGLSHESQLIRDRYLNRDGPGLYVDPFAKRKIGRGRPRNAYIVTVKSELLRNLLWFIPEPEEVSESSKMDKRAIQESDEDDDSSFVGDDNGVQVQSCEPEQPSLQVSTSISTGDAPHSTVDSPHQSDIVHANLTTETSLPATKSNTQGQERSRPLAADDGIMIPHTNFEKEDSVTPAVGSAPATEQDKETMTEETREVLDADATENASPDLQPIPTWTPPTWTAINAPTRDTSTSYQSPYAPASQPESTPTQQREVADGTDEAATGNDVEEPNIQGVYSAISEVNDEDDRAQKATTHKGNKLGGGSWVTFRHAIIREIIDICKGVYPLHGEIGRPFTTLWEQRHPNIKPPNSSTVLSNLRDMISNPDNGLKKLTFLVRLRQGPSLKRREIVAYQHLTPSSPEVMRLAYNMANFPSAKSHQYYPEEIRHLVDETSFYVPVPVAPKDETVNLDHLNPNIDSRIHEAQLKRRRKEYHDKKNEEKARKAQNALVERALAKKAATGGEHPQMKRMRLASLNDKKKRYRRAPLSKPGLDLVEEESGEQSIEQPSQTSPIKHTSLRWNTPWVGPDVGDRQNRVSLDADQRPVQKRLATDSYPSWITAPIIRFYPTNGTFSTEFGLVRAIDLFRSRPVQHLVPASVQQNRGEKRVRISDTPTQLLIKRPRLSKPSRLPLRKSQTISSSSEESEESDTSSSGEEEQNEDTSVSQSTKPKAAKAKMKAKMKRQTTKTAFVPTLLDRLTGLTEISDTPVSHLAKSKRKPHRDTRSWKDRKVNPLNRNKKKQQRVEALEPVSKFKKFCCTLVVASSMAGDDAADWDIVEKVLGGSEFDLSKAKKLWAWVQIKMSDQIAELTAEFQSRFIEAYEQGQVAAIENPETHDWAALVDWTARTCAYTEVSLPSCQDELQQYAVDESRHEALDRPRWYRDKIADSMRTQLQLKYSFLSPLHRLHSTAHSSDDETLKARSWIRANTATPYEKYDRNKAHEKLESMGDSVLTAIMRTYIDQQVMKMRKSKRLLPGRNYDFTARFAKKYGRPFELDDFMAAVKLKKNMDVAFASVDPTKRFYSIPRAEKDGSIMAILSLVSEGRVKLVPKLPPIDNELGAPLPRLSVWGFCEGDYVHRSIDRQRLFWDIHIVPVTTYEFGNPLQPSQPPLLSEEQVKSVPWNSLPAPPLPGMQDPTALLPIWSTIDGQSTTWPWWYRIMNMVLQPLIFQPGVTAMEIHAHCPNNTVEIFEIELMLGWLESVNAVRKTVGGGYMTMPGAWASFGETLLEMENDWLNDHIERKTKRHQRQVWRDQYALQYSNMRQRAEDHEGPQSYVLEKETEARHNRDVVSSTSQQILRNPSLQYAFLQQSQSASGSQDQLGASEQAAVQTKTNAASAQLSAQAIASHSPGGFDKTSGDIEMGGTDTGSRDVDVNTGGEADKRAEENVEESMDEGM